MNRQRVMELWCAYAADVTPNIVASRYMQRGVLQL